MYRAVIHLIAYCYLTRLLSALCPLECVCELDLKGRRKVLCPHGGMSGLIPISEINTNTEVLEISAPSNNQNYLIIGPIFQQFKVLEQLSVTDSNIPNIGKQSFWSLKSLKILNLAHNNISELVDYNFQGLHNLEVLYLDDNRIEQLHSGTFRYLPNLQVLSLVNNLISDLVPRLLLNLGRLHTLNLSGNQLNELKVEVFKDVQELRVLKCRSCTLSFINTELYYLLPYLKEVDLGDNDFKYFLNDAFVDLKRVRTLYLDGNYLSVLLKNFFSGQRQLEQLSVARNRIALITDTAFDNVTTLTDLNLSYNKLRQLTPRVMKPLSKSLEILDLSGNLIAAEHIQLVLRVLPNLKDLSLSEMQLNNLPADMFENNAYVENLNFANNLFHNIITTPLLPLRYLMTLNLTLNRLNGLDEYTITRLDEIPKVFMDNNPWSCDFCHITSMLSRINISRVLRNLTCTSPDKLNGRQLSTLNNLDLEWCGNRNELPNEINETHSFAVRIFGSDQNMNGVIVASISILAVLLVAILALIGFFFYSKRFEADYYTNEEKRANGYVRAQDLNGLGNTAVLLEHLNGKNKQIGEIGYQFNLDVITNGDINRNGPRRPSISLIDPIKEFSVESSHKTTHYIFANGK